MKCHRVPKAELFVFPAYVEVQDFAVPPVMGCVRMDEGDRLVHHVHQAVSGQACLMVLAAGGIKPPVLGYAEGRVVVPPLRMVVRRVPGLYLRPLPEARQFRHL